MTDTDWLSLFPDSDHRFQMGLRVGDAQRFWSSQDPSGKLMEERKLWLQKDAGLYQAELPAGHEALMEARAWMQTWAREPEPDWVVLSGEGEACVLGGEVVFPSSWSLPEKLGLPLPAVHGPVPGLEPALGKGIQVFLSRIQPGSAWERDNWGLSADGELNHHPARSLGGLGETASLQTTWLRLERQFLTRLPATGGLLFGIRVSVHRLDDVVAVPEVASRFVRILETLDEAVAEYKGLTQARLPLLEDLRQLAASAGFSERGASGNGR